jgi:hypothetical protein
MAILVNGFYLHTQADTTRILWFRVAKVYVSLCPPQPRPACQLLQAPLLLYTCARLGKSTER